MPICIPAGPFYVGYAGDSTAQPVRHISLSDYYMDRYPVTRARYQACVDAGACPLPTSPTAYAALRPTQWVNYVTRTEASAFCSWDGGYLPTEFQWEKAARGPDPDMQPHTWGATGGTDCVEHSGTACHEVPFDVDDTVFPGAVSPFGVRMMGTLIEVTATNAGGTYTSLPDGTTDPTGPATSTPTGYFVRRGMVWLDGTLMVSYSGFPDTISYRVSEDRGRVTNGFRCAY
jgi:formylglycine-generating enzyme required for sulfatase activity